ncbi:MAG: hypothetical protein ABEJ28_10745 [Salinigranum sp.]
MTGRLPIGRDSTILLVAVLLGLSIIALVPPSSAPTAAAPGAMAGRGHRGSAAAGASAATPTATPESAAATATGGPSSSAASSSSATSSPTAASSSSGGSGATTRQSNRVKLANTKYAPYAFPISGKTLSSKARRALDGFRRERARINATAVRITLVPYESRYRNYSVVVRKGQTLYFIETSLGDDAPQRETQLNDDAPVKVDKNGYVIQ